MVSCSFQVVEPEDMTDGLEAVPVCLIRTSLAKKHVAGMR